MNDLKILVFMLLLLNSIADQNVLSSKTTYSENWELVQIINFFRHGIYTHDILFSYDEYADYDIYTDPFVQSTYIGNSQSWSLGRQLRLKYSEFFSSFLSSDSKYILQDSDRSISQSEHINCGLIGNYPDWDYDGISELAIEGVETYGYCLECDTTTTIPIVEITTNGVSNETTVSETGEPLMEILDGYILFDIDMICDIILERIELVQELIGSTFESVFGFELDKDEAELIEDTMVKNDEDETYGAIEIMISYHKHISHLLSEISYPDLDFNLVLENVAEIYEWYFTTNFEHLFDDELYFARLYGTELLKSTLDHLAGSVDDYPKVLTYMMHDNNVYALYMLLTETKYEYPYYGTNLRLNIYKDETDTYYVEGFYNGNKMALAGCSTSCLLEDFITHSKSLYIDIEEECYQFPKFIKGNKKLLFD